MERKTHTIDAAGKVLGRLATEVAVLLRGKNKTEFVPHKDVGDFVVVKNIDKIKVTGGKIDKKLYYRHSGYPGGIKQATFREVFEKSPAELFKKTVAGMLPNTKLKKEQIKRLTFK